MRSRITGVRFGAGRVRIASLAVLVPWLVVACGQSGKQAQVAGQMSARWEGSRDGNFTAPASASWCQARRMLEVRSIRGDTGIAMALHPRRSLAAGSYRIVEPAKAESVPPAAAVAVRWVGKNLVQGFRSDSGQLELERSSSGQLSGRLHARARSVVDTERIVLTASFQNVTPDPAVACTSPDTTDEDLAPDDAAEMPETMVN